MDKHQRHILRAQVELEEVQKKLYLLAILTSCCMPIQEINNLQIDMNINFWC